MKMRIGGLLKNSMIDYPGKISCVLFVSGCNFFCPYCHNPALARGERPTPVVEGRVRALLEERTDFLGGVVITGGEPTLSDSLIAFCRRVKQIGYPVKLDTNGSNPDRLTKLIKDGLIDYIAMDVKTDPKMYTPLICSSSHEKKIIRSINRIKKSGLPHEFRTTCAAPFIDRKIMETICRLIAGADLYALQRFGNTKVLNTAFYENRKAGIPEKKILEYKAMALGVVKKCVIR